MCELHFGSWTHEISSLKLLINPQSRDPKHVLGGKSVMYQGNIPTAACITKKYNDNRTDA